MSSVPTGYKLKALLTELIDEALDRLVERLRHAGADEAERLLHAIVVLKRLQEELGKRC